MPSLFCMGSEPRARPCLHGCSLTHCGVTLSPAWLCCACPLYVSGCKFHAGPPNSLPGAASPQKFLSDFFREEREDGDKTSNVKSRLTDHIHSILTDLNYTKIIIGMVMSWNYEEFLLSILPKLSVTWLYSFSIKKFQGKHHLSCTF